jgi:hypothetical protein
MKRLTNRSNSSKVGVIGVDNYSLKNPLSYYKLNLVYSAIERLAEYEDTGLTPRQVRRLIEDSKHFNCGQQRLS